MGLLGLLLATIGQERQSGILRFDFGFIYLWEGLDLIPVLVGIFAIPEIIDLAVRRTAIAGNAPAALGAGAWKGSRILSGISGSWCAARWSASSSASCPAPAAVWRSGWPTRTRRRAPRTPPSEALRLRRCTRRARSRCGE